jgi:hypothetical protein
VGYLFCDDFRVLESLLRPVERFPQSRFFDRLQQIVDGIHLKRAHGVLVVCRDKGD